MRNQLTAGILTGGMARRLQRLGPIDKGLVELQGQPLVAYIAHTFLSLGLKPLLISANRYLDQYQHYGKVIADPADLADYQGPLAGVLALLEQLHTDWLVVLPVDSPFIPADVIQDLWAAHKAQPQGQLFFVQHERSYPLCLLVHRSQKEALRTYLTSGQRRVQSWLQQQQACAVDCRSYPLEAFFNINEPEDIKSAQLRAQQLGLKIPSA